MGEAWLALKDAPYNEVVEVQVGQMTFRAVLRPDAAMSDEETSCDQWQAAIEGEHPPCWSDGACWENNEDDSSSLPPEAWRPIAEARND